MGPRGCAVASPPGRRRAVVSAARRGGLGRLARPRWMSWKLAKVAGTSTGTCPPSACPARAARRGGGFGWPGDRDSSFPIAAVQVADRSRPAAVGELRRGCGVPRALVCPWSACPSRTLWRSRSTGGAGEQGRGLKPRQLSCSQDVAGELGSVRATARPNRSRDLPGVERDERGREAVVATVTGRAR